MNVVRVLLFPFAILFGFVTGLRNLMFDWGVLRSRSYEYPLIGIGNLSTGGTGKTPHIEYLIRLLKSNYRIATLSRGYKRKSRGFILADPASTVDDIGDEPLQMYLKYPDIDVAVCENRNKGIRKILELKNRFRAILLDDVFQHRYVTPGLNILLTDYHNIFTKNYLIPTGNLRESRSGASRADVLIVTKTPRVFSPLDRKLIYDDLKKYRIKKVFFSYITYGEWLPLNQKAQDENKQKAKTIFLITGIANPTPLAEHLKRKCSDIKLFRFSDHHQFSVKELQVIIDQYHATFSGSKAIVTTEKDSMRLRSPKINKLFRNIPVYYVPIEVEFHGTDKEDFNALIFDYINQKSPRKQKRKSRPVKG
jgi:tetraacyldisaccharide 4'-kinase